MTKDRKSVRQEPVRNPGATPYRCPFPRIALPEPEPAPVEEQSARAVEMVAIERGRAPEFGLCVFFLLEVNSALFAHWQEVGVPESLRRVQIIEDPRLRPGYNGGKIWTEPGPPGPVRKS